MSYAQIAKHYADRLRQRFTKKWDKHNAATLLEMLADLHDEKSAEAEHLAAECTRQRARAHTAEQNGKSLLRRALLSLDELSVYKGHSPTRVEQPAAVLMSPYQYEQALGNGCVGVRGEKVKTLSGYPIYLASGMSGPVFVTQSALDGLSRQAPELNLRAP